MNILIPLGGIGKRFSDYGYHMPKPLIKVLGKEIIFWLLDSLKINEEDKIYIPYNEHLEYFNFGEIINSKYPNIQHTPIPDTRGASETILMGLEHFNLEGKIVILDGDTWYNENILEKIRNVEGNSVLYFDSKNPNPIYSYIQIKDGSITNIKEKIKISNNANSGCYVFESTKKLKEQILKIGFESKNELYTSQVIGKMIESGENFIPIKVEDFYVLGTPQQIIQFSKTYEIPKKRFCFDLDNTLVTYPKIEGDYTTVEPISDTINYLKKLKEKGHTIIIYTARRMRTHSGNIGGVIADIGKITIDTLHKYNIPYDELYFGKPYAHYYIDDLMVNPKTDLNKTLGFYMEDVSARHFNEVEIGNTFIKKSNDPKLQGEIEYYKWVQENGTEEIQNLFPKLISYTDNSLELEMIQGINFSTMYVNNILTTDHLQLLFNKIELLHGHLESNKIYYGYSNLSSKFIERTNMYDYKSYGITESDIEQIKEELVKIENEGHMNVMVHGDCVFSNVLLTNTGDVKFVDVRGVVGNKKTCYGLCLYDYAKIYQSLIGYDEILMDKKIKKSYKDNMLNYFKKHVGDNFTKIEVITKSLILSLVPLHDDFEKIKKYIILTKTTK
jgi:capsule biosynthesis phosphatase